MDFKHGGRAQRSVLPIEEFDFNKIVGVEENTFGGNKMRIESHRCTYDNKLSSTKVRLG